MSLKGAKTVMSTNVNFTFRVSSDLKSRFLQICKYSHRPGGIALWDFMDHCVSSRSIDIPYLLANRADITTINFDADSTFTFKVDSVLKSRFFDLCNDLGVSSSAAIKRYMTRSVELRRLSFPS